MKCDNKCKYFDEEDGCLYSYMGDGNLKHAPCFQNSTGEQTMDDLISRQAAIDKVINLWADKPFGNPTLVEIKDCIEALPSAERKGTWIYHTEPLAFRPYGHYTCNLCNEISWDKSNFCPNCGAKMDEGGDAK